MKKLVCVIVVCLLLAGCASETYIEETVPYWAGHENHTAAQARNQYNFDTEVADDEGQSVYLVYKEPDGCVTQVAQIGRVKAPSLFCEENTFFYMDGSLCAVTFTGDKSCFLAQDLEVDSILRVKDGNVYCSANEGQIYLCVDVTLTNWKEISKEEAVS